MGECMSKLPTVDDPARGPNRSKKGATVSLERVLVHASNIASVTSRYHGIGSGHRLKDDYHVFPNKVLGEGCNGSVVMARNMRNFRMYALKRIKKSKVEGTMLRQLISEVEIYLMLDHPNVTRLYDVYETQSEVALLTECCEGGELYTRLARSGTFPESQAARTTQQMLLAVAYLHSHSIVHRDLKLENWLYEGKDDRSPLKLIDFGFAKIWDASTLMMASCGSMAYVSPDVLRGNGYTSKCDLWSLGVIVFMMLVGYPPFHGSDKEMKQSITSAKPDWTHKEAWKGVSHDAKDFIKTLLVKDPEVRSDARTALQHRWITKNRSKHGPISLGKDMLRSLRYYARSSRVRRAALQILAQELSASETRELRQAFLSMDKSFDGTVSLAELKDAIRGVRESSFRSNGSTHSPRTPAAKLRRAKTEVIIDLFDVLDANGDEQVYFSDFLAATLNVKADLPKDVLLAAFARFDADKSGTITARDLHRVLGDSFEGVNVELVFKEADRHGKGEVTFDDFIRVIEELPETPTSKSRVRVDAAPSEALTVGDS